MQRLMVLGVALVVAGLVGCNTSERGGKKDDKTPGKETFTIKAPATSTTVKQGETRKIELTLNRGKEFKQDVSLSADAPTGLTVELDPKTVKAGGDEKVTATVTAAKDAPVGDESFTVTAKPKEGNSTDVKVKVKVEKAKGD